MMACDSAALAGHKSAEGWRKKTSAEDEEPLRSFTRFSLWLLLDKRAFVAALDRLD